MQGHGSQFGRKRDAAIEALLTQPNVEEAARAVGIGRQTLYSWLKDPEFQAAYQEARRTVFGQSIARLQRGAGAAATTMLMMLVDKTVPAAVRLRAADHVLRHALQGMENEDLDVRVAALEKMRKSSERTR